MGHYFSLQVMPSLISIEIIDFLFLAPTAIIMGKSKNNYSALNQFFSDGEGDEEDEENILFLNKNASLIGNKNGIQVRKSMSVKDLDFAKPDRFGVNTDSFGNAFNPEEDDEIPRAKVIPRRRRFKCFCCCSILLFFLSLMSIASILFLPIQTLDDLKPERIYKKLLNRISPRVCQINNVAQGVRVFDNVYWRNASAATPMYIHELSDDLGHDNQANALLMQYGLRNSALAHVFIKPKAIGQLFKDVVFPTNSARSGFACRKSVPNECFFSTFDGEVFKYEQVDFEILWRRQLRALDGCDHVTPLYISPLRRIANITSPTFNASVRPLLIYEEHKCRHKRVRTLNFLLEESGQNIKRMFGSTRDLLSPATVVTAHRLPDQYVTFVVYSAPENYSKLMLVALKDFLPSNGEDRSKWTVLISMPGRLNVNKQVQTSDITGDGSTDFIIPDETVIYAISANASIIWMRRVEEIFFGENKAAGTSKIEIRDIQIARFAKLVVLQICIKRTCTCSTFLLKQDNGTTLSTYQSDCRTPSVRFRSAYRASDLIISVPGKKTTDELPTNMEASRPNNRYERSIHPQRYLNRLTGSDNDSIEEFSVEQPRFKSRQKFHQYKKQPKHVVNSANLDDDYEAAEELDENLSVAKKPSFDRTRLNQAYLSNPNLLKNKNEVKQKFDQFNNDRSNLLPIEDATNNRAKMHYGKALANSAHSFEKNSVVAAEAPLNSDQQWSDEDDYSSEQDEASSESSYESMESDENAKPILPQDYYKAFDKPNQPALHRSNVIPANYKINSNLSSSAPSPVQHKYEQTSSPSAPQSDESYVEENDSSSDEHAQVNPPGAAQISSSESAGDGWGIPDFGEKVLPEYSQVLYFTNANKNGQPQSTFKFNDFVFERNGTRAVARRSEAQVAIFSGFNGDVQYVLASPVKRYAEQGYEQNLGTLVEVFKLHGSESCLEVWE